MISERQEDANPLLPGEQSSNFLMRWIPALALVKSYKRQWLLKDIGAGLVLTTVLVPVGMGYAEAAGLPAICGLYASIFALIVYALLGQSRILIIGPDSALVPIIAATVLPLAQAGSARAVELASALAIMSGVFCLAMGFLKFGFITDLLSKPIRFGYLNAIALTLIVGQLSIICCIPISALNLLQEAGDLAAGLLAGKINPASFLIGATCLLIILLFKRFAPKWPAALIAVSAATIIVACLGLSEKQSVQVVGSLPQGLPAFKIPQLSFNELNGLLTSAAAIAFVSFADMIVVSRTFASRAAYEVDDNRELLTLGAANIAAGLFQGFSVTGSASRTPVAESAGARTQITGVVAALSVAALMLFAQEMLEFLPRAALAAVVISAALSLVEIRGIFQLYKVRKMELLSLSACFLGVSVAGVIAGVIFALLLAFLSFVWRASRPYCAVLGRVNELKGYHDIIRHPEASRIPGLVLFRWDAPLFFANARSFREQVLKACSQNPGEVKRVVVEAAPVTDIDFTAADELAQLKKDLFLAGAELAFAQMKGPVKDQLKSYGLYYAIGEENFFPTLGRAVDHYLQSHDIEWHDWEDESCHCPAPHAGPCPRS